MQTDGIDCNLTVIKTTKIKDVLETKWTHFTSSIPSLCLALMFHNFRSDEKIDVNDFDYNLQNLSESVSHEKYI